MTSILRRPTLTALLLLGLAASALQAQPAPAPAPAPAAPAPAPTPAPAAAAPASTAPVVDAKTADVLHKLVDNYKSIKSAQAQITIAMKFSGAGRTDQINSTADFAFERPNKIALTMKDEKTGGGSVVSDGKKMWMTVAGKNQYSEEESPANLDQILVNSPAQVVARQASILLVLFHSQAYDKLLDGVSNASYIGQDDIDGVKCDHVRLAMEGVDINLWSTAGDKPLLRRVKPDLSRRIKQAAEQQPEMKDATFDGSIDVKDWKIDQPVAATQFAFSPTVGTEKVDSMEEVLAGDQPAMKLKGLAAPEATFDLLGGGKTTLADHKGKDVVILDFWATWCGPCVEGLPVTAQVAREYAGKNVVLYAMNQQEEESLITPFLKQHNLDIKVGLDKDGSIGKAFRVEGIPQTIIVGKDGIIKAVHIGFSPNLKALLTHDIEKALAAK